MAMALTFAQVFLGALTVGIGLSRGVEADLAFHSEDLTGEANYAASRLAAGHAHATNAIADDNVLAVAAMAPRLAIEADNITMDMNAAIACPQPLTPGMQEICAAYTANKPRALAKLGWVRTQQTSMWQELETLSAAMDKVAGAHARDDIGATLHSLDPSAHVRFDDPTQLRETWTGRSAFTGCSLASKDALSSPMTGHAFPILMPNLLAGLPQALVAGLPSAMCPPLPSGAPPKPVKLPEIPSVMEKAKKRCEDKQDKQRRDDCMDKALEDESAAFLKSIGLPPIATFAMIGGSTRAPGALNPNISDDFRIAATVMRPADARSADIAESARTLMSFGNVETPTELRRDVVRTSSAKWYFPSGAGPFVATPPDQRAFVAAWKHTLTAGR